jgi:hypothetical protein
MNDGKYICELCCPTLVVYGEIVPGYAFAYNPDSDSKSFKREHYLVLPHFGHGTTLFAFPQDPVESTYDRYTREAVDSWSDDDPRHDVEEKHLDCMDGMEAHFRCSPEDGYSFIKACLDAGWRWQNSGMVLPWLINRMARMIAEYNGTKR